MRLPAVLYACSILYSLSVLFPNIVKFLSSVRASFLSLPFDLPENVRLGIAAAIFVIAILAQFWAAKERMKKALSAEPKPLDPELRVGLDYAHKTHQWMDFVLTGLVPVLALCCVLLAFLSVIWPNH